MLYRKFEVVKAGRHVCDIFLRHDVTGDKKVAEEYCGDALVYYNEKWVNFKVMDAKSFMTAEAKNKGD